MSWGGHAATRLTCNTALQLHALVSPTGSDVHTHACVEGVVLLHMENSLHVYAKHM